MTGADRAIEDLTATVNSVGSAWSDRDAGEVAAGAAHLLKVSDELNGQGGLSMEASASLWLIARSAESLMEALAEPTLDWDRIGAASSFAESGVDQLREALS